MSRMRRLATGLVGAMAVAVGAAAMAQSPIAQFMRPKLDYSKAVLEGLALEDFPKIAQNARALRNLSEAAEWQALPDLDYVRYSAEFQRATNEMVRHANEKNLDAATLSFVEMTMTCVRCHQFVRQKNKVARSLRR